MMMTCTTHTARQISTKIATSKQKVRNILKPQINKTPQIQLPQKTLITIQTQKALIKIRKIKAEPGPKQSWWTTQEAFTSFILAP